TMENAMMMSDRHKQIISALKEHPQITVKELAKMLYVSEPTIRRDFTVLDKKGIITKVYGGAKLNQGYADREIPFSFRQNEKSTVKSAIGKKAGELVKDGMVVMLDGSTSSYYLAEFLTKKKDLIVITSGAKTAVALAEANIRVFCTGGQMITNSFSYVGQQAEDFVKNINADILFFSCRGVTFDGKMTDLSIEESNLRRAMMKSCNKKYLLCDGSKFGKTYFYNIGTVSELDGIISEQQLPEAIQKIGQWDDAVAPCRLP
ncbi:MAG: DeoR/GlpR transcriptional regulator, partial [Oscillospiraceae bacterium]|nr:DeoR/GlpR transcriptional regulator [Candidatus Equicaccousia limihippi]